MEPRAEIEEKMLRALAAAAQALFDQYGIRIGSASFSWNGVGGFPTYGFKIKSVSMRTDKTDFIRS